MLKFYSTIYYILIITGFLIYYGCGSSSGTSRYGNQTEDSDTQKSANRFSSEDDNYGYMVIGDDSVSMSLIDDLEDSGDLPEDDNVDISEVINRYSSTADNNVLKNDYGTTKEKMLMEIIRHLNTPYKYGGNSKKGIDCSAFTQTVYKNTLSLDLFRSAREQYEQGEVVNNVEDLQFGDLVFFNTRKNVRPGHVGIYIGDLLFAHASTKKGVTVSSLTHLYYQNRFMGGRRIKQEGTF